MLAKTSEAMLTAIALCEIAMNPASADPDNPDITASSHALLDGLEEGDAGMLASSLVYLVSVLADLLPDGAAELVLADFRRRALNGEMDAR